MKGRRRIGYGIGIGSIVVAVNGIGVPGVRRGQVGVGVCVCIGDTRGLLFGVGVRVAVADGGTKAVGKRGGESGAHNTGGSRNGKGSVGLHWMGGGREARWVCVCVGGAALRFMGSRWDGADMVQVFLVAIVADFVAVVVPHVELADGFSVMVSELRLADRILSILSRSRLQSRSGSGRSLSWSRTLSHSRSGCLSSGTDEDPMVMFLGLFFRVRRASWYNEHFCVGWKRDVVLVGCNRLNNDFSIAVKEKRTSVMTSFLSLSYSRARAHQGLARARGPAHDCLAGRR